VFQIKIHLERIWNTLVRLKQVKIRDCSTVPDVPDGLAQKKNSGFPKRNIFHRFDLEHLEQHKIKLFEVKISVPDAFQIKIHLEQLPFKD